MDLSSLERCLALTMFLLFLGASSDCTAQGQSFSCNFGTRPTCLNIYDKVVDDSAVCFNRNTCDYNGFTCKSNVDELAGKYDRLVLQYNELLSTSKTMLANYNDLLEKNKTLARLHNDLLQANQSLTQVHENLRLKGEGVAHDYEMLAFKYARLNTDYKDRLSKMNDLRTTLMDTLASQDSCAAQRLAVPQKKK